MAQETGETDMTTLSYNLDIGTIKLKKRGKKGTFHLFISFKDLGGSNLYRASTNTSILKQAEPKAIAMAQQEHARRKAGIILTRTITPSKYLEEIHIPWLLTQVDLPLDNKPNRTMSLIKAKSNGQVLMKHFHPYLLGKNWEHIQTSRFGRDITAHLRRCVSDTTLCSYFGYFNRMLRQAEIDGHSINNKLEGVPALSQEGFTRGTKEKRHSYAVASDEMIHGLLQHTENRIARSTRKDVTRTYTQALAWIRILADTGMRPFTLCPLNWNDIEVRGEMVLIDRREKSKRYIAQGGSMTKRALDDLRMLYLSEGTNVNQRKHLPLIHHQPKGNKYFQTVVAPYSQITKFHRTLNKLMEECGWFDMRDKEMRMYRAYSIRKWHINKSIESDEDRFQIADRVGHTYAVLEKFYLNADLNQKVKADIWQFGTNTSNQIKRT